MCQAERVKLLSPGFGLNVWYREVVVRPADVEAHIMAKAKSRSERFLMSGTTLPPKAQIFRIARRGRTGEQTIEALETLKAQLPEFGIAPSPCAYRRSARY